MIIRVGDVVRVRCGFWTGYTGTVKCFVADGTDEQYAAVVQLSDVLAGMWVGRDDNIIVTEITALEVI